MITCGNVRIQIVTCDSRDIFPGDVSNFLINLIIVDQNCRYTLFGGSMLAKVFKNAKRRRFFMDF